MSALDEASEPFKDVVARVSTRPVEFGDSEDSADAYRVFKEWTPPEDEREALEILFASIGFAVALEGGVWYAQRHSDLPSSCRHCRGTGIDPDSPPTVAGEHRVEGYMGGLPPEGHYVAVSWRRDEDGEWVQHRSEPRPLGERPADG